uniref:Uncharacterized protein n=1 Tax=Paraclostridium sordellii TaxID=1505 RepID=A0A2I6SWF9_PARSO|nr:hypothetical protein [Paeniclostridium sordellii]AUO31855.1 hypothetical protein [Paeniclostridium sordellii]
MNNRENLRSEILSFLKDKEEKVMFIKGTYQHEKHRELLRVLMKSSDPGTNVLLRLNGKENIKSMLTEGIAKKGLNTRIKLKNINLYIDTLNCRTWKGGNYNIVIIYPIDPLCRDKEKTRKEVMENLSKKVIDKLFIVSWTDHYDYSWLEKYNIDRTVTFDAEEEDKAYHGRVLDLLRKYK